MLLIGGMGFIVMHTARALLDAGENVAVTWYSTRRLPEYEKNRGIAVYLDWLRSHPQ